MLIFIVKISLSGRDTDEAILKMYGKLGEDEKREHEQPKTQSCQICGHENAPEADFCLKRRKPLSLKAALKLDEKEREFLKLMTPETIEQLIQKKVEEILAKRSQQNLKGGDRDCV
ncbi:MAG: hypothetical protein HY929_05955 [Euryarchaeota archaeon]|nr:hypothetical protein [Euryarchaeota archaeon]